MNRFIRQLAATIRSNVKSTAFFRQKLALDVILTVFRVLVLLLVYVNVYKIAPQAESILPYESTMWSLGAYFIMLAFNARRMYAHISELIYSGNIELYLVRPMHFVAFMAAQIIGKGLIQTGITTAAVCVVLLLIVGLPPQLSFLGILLILVFIFLGLVIDLLIGAIVGMLAVWLENAKPVYWIVDKFVLILGGSYVPVAFFPDILKTIAKLSPFGATRFVSFAFYPDISTQAVRLVLVQVVWCVLLLFLLRLQYRSVQRHLFVNGS